MPELTPSTEVPVAPAVAKLPPLRQLSPEQIATLVDSDEAHAILAIVKQHIDALPAVGTKGTPGWQTSEFYVSIFFALGALLTSLGGVVPPKWGVLCAALSGACYTLSRGVAKHNAGN